MKRICILLLSAVLAATAVGQTVTGRVVDDESGEALPSASVYAKSLAKGTSTDSDGRSERTTRPWAGSSGRLLLPIWKTPPFP